VTDELVETDAPTTPATTHLHSSAHVRVELPAQGRAGVDHACMAMPDFDPAKVTQLLVDYGLTRQDGQGRTPLVTYISLRMPNRGGAEGGTPELYFTDPDGLAIQLQDVKYCGGGGFLGEVCPPL